MKVIITKNYDEMSQKASELVRDLVNEKPDAILGLATGGTPEGLYANLVEYYENGDLSFKDVKTYNLDEYVGLSGDHDQSYRYYMNEKLFDKVDINKENTHVPNGKADDLEKEAKDYEALIDELSNADLQILGIGTNGHIGFNEPDENLQAYTHVADLTQSTIDANARYFDNADDVPKTAISMGIASILKAKKIVLMASGKNKADAISTFKTDLITTQNPASLIKLHPDVTLIIDEDAAGRN